VSIAASAITSTNQFVAMDSLPTMLSPNTAQPGQSVWDYVGRNTFENGIDRLHGTRFVPEPYVLHDKDWPKPRGTDLLPFAIEMQLSDDIAFVSAYEYGVGYVTAATVEASKQGGLVVRLAANEGVCLLVNDAWKRLLAILERCAKKGQSSLTAYI
jgi:hypothetical protein